MSNIRGNTLTNAFVFLCLLVLTCAFQTTLWPVITTSIQPHIWVCIFTYVSLYRDSRPALALLFLSGLILKSFTLFPASYLLLAILLSHLILKQLKDRTFWKGSSYYIICTFFATLLFGLILSFIESIAYGEAVLFSVPSWLFSALLNLPFSILLYGLMSKIDKLTSMPLPAETGYNQYV